MGGGLSDRAQGLAAVAVATTAATCDPPDHPSAPNAQITVTGQKNQTGGDITINDTVSCLPGASHQDGFSAVYRVCV